MLNVLITGASGFLGKMIFDHYSSQNTITIGRSNSSDLICDLSKETPILSKTNDLVIHAAGLAHTVPRTQRESQAFFDINVNGTINLLKSLKASTKPKSFVFISSVSVYGRERGLLITENEPLLGMDPYSRSKIEAEQIVQNWCIENNVISTILRLPLLVGTHPPGNLGAMIKGIQKGYYINVGGGEARKSMVLAKDVVSIIPKIAYVGGIYNLTDREHPSFSELSFNIADQLGKSHPLNIPKWLAELMGKAGDILGKYAPINSSKLMKITNHLTFDDQKAVDAFGWNPTPVLNGFKIY